MVYKSHLNLPVDKSYPLFKIMLYPQSFQKKSYGLSFMNKIALLGGHKILIDKWIQMEFDV